MISEEKKECRLQVITMSPQQVAQSNIKEIVNHNFGLEHFVSIVSVENLKETTLKVKFDRPLFKDYFSRFPESERPISVIETNKDTMVSVQKILGQEFPVVTMVSSKGFIPGEKFNVSLLDKNNNLLGAITFIPYPLEKTSIDGKAKVIAEYSILQPSFYSIKFEGFEKGEEVMFESLSGLEKIPKQKFNTDVPEIGYANGVVNQDGGKSRVTVERKNGEKIVLELPWGKEVLPYILP
ncbi:MAG: hypothetical protein WB791_04940 [Waddliaceae bacterium]